MGDRIGGVIIVLALILFFALLADGLWAYCTGSPEYAEYCVSYGCP